MCFVPIIPQADIFLSTGTSIKRREENSSETIVKVLKESFVFSTVGRLMHSRRETTAIN